VAITAVHRYTTSDVSGQRGRAAKSRLAVHAAASRVTHSLTRQTRSYALWAVVVTSSTSKHDRADDSLTGHPRIDSRHGARVTLQRIDPTRAYLPTVGMRLNVSG